jgi:hypothetical protein
VITAAHLTEGRDSVDRTVYTSASIAPAGSQLVVAGVHVRSGSGVTAAISLAGGGMTAWDTILDFEYDTVGTGTNKARIAVFRSLQASPSSGTVSIDCGATAVGACEWTFAQFDGVDTSGANGAGAVVQSAQTVADSAAATSATITLSAFGSVDNAAFGFFGIMLNEIPTLGAGFTGLNLGVSGTAPVTGSRGEWKLNDDTVDMSWSSAVFGGIAIEIKAAVAAAAGKAPVIITPRGTYI